MSLIYLFGFLRQDFSVGLEPVLCFLGPHMPINSYVSNRLKKKKKDWKLLFFKDFNPELEGWIILIPMFRRQRQGYLCDLEGILVIIVTPCPKNEKQNKILECKKIQYSEKVFVRYQRNLAFENLTINIDFKIQFILLETGACIMCMAL